jgi:hypothetical protein
VGVEMDKNGAIVVGYYNKSITGAKFLILFVALTFGAFATISC